MAAYRVFRVDETGHVHGDPETITAGTDAEALRRASDVLGDYSLELWDGARYMATLTRNPATPHADWIVVARPNV